ncbi:uracil-DNA glycosylase [Lentithecium fluviatile CBS 122367]|uniref:Uracil-DNA glycosylase n=1 Tax=Lentithecium fluviatile CBS 122367 TaxID=1168545 RepID=A0A6G1ILG4_9PLEO|nr:uracil-DNA glycosylase [Lentithecium fluviatile CBS 122367]
MSLKRKAADAATDAAKKTKPNGSITSFFGAPKPKADTTAAKFDKEKWISGLTAEQKDLLKLEIDTLHESWLPHLKDVLVSPTFLELKRFLKTEAAGSKTIYPPMQDVYSWSRHTPLNTVKAVITGQDPYHGPNQAHGLCFSVRPPTPAPPSLKNIYIALKKDYPDFKAPPKNGGLLTPWADRGVLMINTVLTVRRGEANSHKGKGWELLTQKVIDTVAKVRTNGVVFLAWGSPAAERVKGVNKEKHLILRSVHPSPLAAHKGFFDCGHFKKANEWLVQRYGKDGGIDWNLNVDPEEAGV